MMPENFPDPEHPDSDGPNAVEEDPTGEPEED